MKKLLVALIFLSSFSINAMNSSSEEDLNAPASAAAPLLPVTAPATAAATTAPPKKHQRIAFVTALLATFGLMGNVVSPINSIYLTNEMVQAASPITAIPAQFNCSGIETGPWQEQPCPPIFPNITKKSDCTYEQYTSGSYPPDYVKGECACERPSGCACWIERCEGADKFEDAYVNHQVAVGEGIGGSVLTTAAVATAAGAWRCAYNKK